MNIVTPPKKDLKTRPYSMDMNKDIATLPKKGLKTRPYNIGMEKEGLKKYDYNIDMEKKDLKKRTEGQLIKLVLKQEAKKPIPPPITGKWKSVNEDIIIPPPEQFRDGYKPIPKPIIDRPFQMQNVRRPPKPTGKTPQPQNQRTISISMMTYSKLKTQVLEISK